MSDVLSQLSDLSRDRRELLERLLGQRGAGPRSAIPPRPAAGDAPLSFAQDQVWFLNQLEPGNPAYNIAASIRFRGALDAAALEQALRTLVGRHDILRTALVPRGGQPVQVVAPDAPLDVPVTDLRASAQGEREDRAR